MKYSLVKTIISSYIHNDNNTGILIVNIACKVALEFFVRRVTSYQIRNRANLIGRLRGLQFTSIISETKCLQYQFCAVSAVSDKIENWRASSDVR